MQALFLESTMTSTTSRLNELEMRMAHQDRTIADLNDVITAQWKKIEALENQLRRMGEELQSLEPSDTATNQKPPHY